MLQGKIDLLSNTNMVDFAKEVYMRLHPETTEVPECKPHHHHRCVCQTLYQ